MADPLSVAASIAGLLALAEFIVIEGRDFIKDATNAKKEVEDLITEVISLSGVLQGIRLIAIR